MENAMTDTAVSPSYWTHVTTLMTPPFAMSGATSVSNGLPIAGTGVVVVDQRPRTVTKGRPPRGNHC